MENYFQWFGVYEWQVFIFLSILALTWSLTFIQHQNIKISIFGFIIIGYIIYTFQFTHGFVTATQLITIFFSFLISLLILETISDSLVGKLLVLISLICASYYNFLQLEKKIEINKNSTHIYNLPKCAKKINDSRYNNDDIPYKSDGTDSGIALEFELKYEKFCGPLPENCYLNDMVFRKPEIICNGLPSQRTHKPRLPVQSPKN